jgi:soluble lytic murein transglycosylase-like protein
MRPQGPAVMQPVNPIPHLPVTASLQRRPPPQAGSGAFRQALGRAAARQRPAVGPTGTTAPRGRTHPAPAGHRPGAASLLRFEAPRVYRYSERRAGGMKSSVAVGAPRDPSDAAADAGLLARIHSASQRLGVDPALSEAIGRAESNLNESARSPDGKSEGAFQMKRPTIAEMRRRMKDDPTGLPLSDEVTLAVGYLRYLDDLFTSPAVLDRAGNTTMAISESNERRLFAIAAYNAGEGRVAAAQRQALARGGDPQRFSHVRPFLPAITQRYVERVLQFAAASH